MNKKPPHRLSPAEARDFLKNIFADAGIKLTPQRIEIFRAVYGTDSHPSAEVIYDKLKQKMPSISLDTIYRTLATLEKLGLVNRVSALDRQSRYDANIDIHHHFICTQCGKISDFYWPSFDDSTLPEELAGKGRVMSKHIEVRGICRDCLKKNQDDD